MRRFRATVISEKHICLQFFSSGYFSFLAPSSSYKLLCRNVIRRLSGTLTTHNGCFMSNKISSAILLFALPLAAYATEFQMVERPRQECWNEQVPVQSAGSGVGGAIIGGIAGGLLGNQVGGGNGRTVATAVGAATGAVVGDRMSSGGTSYQTVQRCRTVVEQVRVPVVREAAPVVIVRQPVPVVEERVYYIEDERHHHHHEHSDRGWHGRGHGRDDD
jgi:uncharacterized protein YcfJ